jgi:hypothetical protein
MIFIFLLLFCSNALAVQQTMPNGDVVDVEGNVTYLITPGESTQALQILNAQKAADQQSELAAQVQLDNLRKQALNSMLDAQLSSNPTTQSQVGSLKQQGAQ